MPCRIRKRDEWTLRILLEAKLHVWSSFFTLTYDENSLPEDGSLKVSDLQLFLKRLRKHFRTGAIRYFISGEYGPRTDRPHYHGVLFGVHPLVLEDSLDKAWKNGFTTVSSLTPQRARYVAKYTTKQALTSPLSGTTRKREFSIQSRNPALGVTYLPHVAAVLRHQINSGIIRVSRGGELRLPAILRVAGRCYPLSRELRQHLRQLLDLPKAINRKGVLLTYDNQATLLLTHGDPDADNRAADYRRAEQRFRIADMRAEL